MAFSTEITPGDQDNELTRSTLPPISDIVGSEAASNEDASIVGRKVGPYEIRAHIASGGMGAVYRAARVEDYGQEVAIKRIRAGIGQPEMIRRFNNERQLLANLKHPNIARLLDGGTDDEGYPFLVMEYIDGEPITTFCDRGNLSIDERLKLFCKVCNAVQYAHQNAMIHRDLKPSNILVTSDGTPKLLDFGLAKLLQTSETASFDLTQPDLRPMTPAYASPEQFRGDALTTATDLYSLGAILYELLTGRRPIPINPLDVRDFERAVCEDEPVPPSVAAGSPGPRADGSASSRQAQQKARSDSRRLRGDLDTIVLKCLRKEPARRYVTVDQLLEDIDRHLDGRPILARRESRWYVASRIARRNFVPIAAGLLVFASLGVGVVVAVNAAMKERELTGKANDSLKIARKSEHDLRVQAARMASQRGQWRTTIENYQQALGDGLELGDELSLRIGLVEAMMAINDQSAAKTELDCLPKDLGRHSGSVFLLKGDQIMSGLGDVDGALKLVSEARATGTLSPEDDAFAAALSAPTPEKSIELLNKALAINPFHHRSHNLLLIQLVMLGDYRQLIDRCNTFSILFPEDPLPVISLAFGSALHDDAEAAEKSVQRFESIGQVQPEQLEAVRMLVKTLLDLNQAMKTGSLSNISLSLFKNSGSLTASTSKAQGSGNALGLLAGSVNLPSFRNSYGLIVEQLRNPFRKNADKAAILKKATQEMPNNGLLAFFYAEFSAPEMTKYIDKPAELKKYLEDLEVAYRRAADGPLFLEGVRRTANTRLLWAQSLLGRSTRMGPGDPLMRERLVHRMMDRLANPQTDLQELEFYIGLCFEMKNDEVADLLAHGMEQRSPQDERTLVARCRVESASGRHASTIKAADAVLKINPKSTVAIDLRKSASEALVKETEATKKVNPVNPGVR